MITIDGAKGEGGGQILRSSLALSLVTGTPFRIHSIRARRKKPGLMRQHLTAVIAATQIGNATTRGAELHSTELIFEPGTVAPGDYHFAVGTAGSTTLVLQTVLPPLLNAAAPSTIRVTGGTHNPLAPPYRFLAEAFLPLINRMGPNVTATLERPGFFPAGGGEITLAIVPAEKLKPLSIETRGEIRSIIATATVAHLHRNIAERELTVIRQRIGLAEENLQVEERRDSHGPGNVVTIAVTSDALTEIFTGFGEAQRSAEKVATGVVQEARRYISSGVPVGEYLTDQLLIPLALARGGTFRTLGLSPHAQTNIEVIEEFLPVKFSVRRDDEPGCIVQVNR